MPSESGDMKVLGNFRRLIDQVSAHAGYNPSNPLLVTAALEARHAAALAAVQSVSTKLAPYSIAVNERLLAFDAMSELVPRSHNMLKASGASKEVLADAETPVRKILGRRKPSKAGDGKTAPGAAPASGGGPAAPPDKPETPEKEAAASHSSSQMSFDNRLGNLNGYIAVLANVPAYNPNENAFRRKFVIGHHNDLKVQTSA